MAERFERYLAGYADLTAAELRAELAISDAPDPRLGFDPRTARYYAEVVRALKLTSAEQQLLARQGVVSVDHAQRYSMGSAYFAIYARDMPVLITTDSILHALHRSYDTILMQLEASMLTALAGGSFGQLVTRVAVVRLDNRPVSFLHALGRTALICLVVPPLVFNRDNRGLHDLAVGTVTLRR